MNNFQMAMRQARCPNDGGKVFPLRGIQVVCEVCSTVYFLAVRVGLLTMSWKLVEKPQKVKIERVFVTKTVEREVIKLRCDYCRAMNELGKDKTCRNCGAAVR
jgi:hypothetical protein